MKTVNNSEITTVINQTQNLSVVSTTISIPYEESLARVELVIRDNLDRIRRNIPEIAEGLFYKGVTAHSASSVGLLFMSNCREEDYFPVGRAMNRELKLLFDENGIETRTTRSSSTRRRIRRLTTPPTARPGRPRGLWTSRLSSPRIWRRRTAETRIRHGRCPDRIGSAALAWMSGTGWIFGRSQQGSVRETQDPLKCCMAASPSWLLASTT